MASLIVASGFAITICQGSGFRVWRGRGRRRAKLIPERENERERERASDSRESAREWSSAFRKDSAGNRGVGEDGGNIERERER
jgi:hypothetical protein